MLIMHWTKDQVANQITHNFTEVSKNISTYHMCNVNICECYGDRGTGPVNTRWFLLMTESHVQLILLWFTTTFIIDEDAKTYLDVKQNQDVIFFPSYFMPLLNSGVKSSWFNGKKEWWEGGKAWGGVKSEEGKKGRRAGRRTGMRANEEEMIWMAGQAKQTSPAMHRQRSGYFCGDGTLMFWNEVLPWRPSHCSLPPFHKVTGRECFHVQTRVQPVFSAILQNSEYEPDPLRAPPLNYSQQGVLSGDTLSSIRPSRSPQKRALLTCRRSRHRLPSTLSPGAGWRPLSTASGAHCHC